MLLPNKNPQGNSVQGIVEREVFRSGTTSDGRKISHGLIKEIYRNTQAYILGREIDIPVKLGHEDKSEVLSGRVIGLTLKRSGLFSRELSIWAQIELYDDAYKYYLSGRLPGASVELAAKGYDIDGAAFGNHIMSIAFLGSNPAAIPWMEYQCNPFADKAFLYSVSKNTTRIHLEDDAMNFVNKLKEFVKNNNKYSFQTEGNALIKLKDMLTKAAAMVDEIIQQGVESADEPMEPEFPNKKEDENMENKDNDFMKAINARFEKLEEALKEKDEIIDKLKSEKKDTDTEFKDNKISQAFQRLREKNKLGADQEPRFQELVNAMGIDWATQYFESQPSVDPNAFKNDKNGKKIIDSDMLKNINPETIQAEIQLYKNMGYTVEEIAKDMKVEPELIQNYYKIA